MDANGLWYGLISPPKSRPAPGPPVRILVIGAGSRGNAYAHAVTTSTRGIIHAVAEPIPYKRRHLGQSYIWHDGAAAAGQAFRGWQEFLTYERRRRERVASAEGTGEEVEAGVDAVFVCTLDEQHADIVVALAPLGLHVLCEKPLATTLDDCLRIYRALTASTARSPPAHPPLFSIGHVLRYSPHNILLRRLLLTDRRIGSPLSLEHTEPVGWWHFSHSYVRGNWRRSDTTAASLLTKSCHDIDLLLWLFAAPPDPEAVDAATPHLPARVASAGRLNQFRRLRKPEGAGRATNCLSCPVESGCLYSAKKIYLEQHLRRGNTGWPVNVVVPEIEDLYHEGLPEAAEARLMETLGEDYDAETPEEVIRGRNWFGRCVWEADNDVCDDQTVVVSWDDELRSGRRLEGAGDGSRLAKTATLHMIAQSEAQCARRGVIYGTVGEITYDSTTIRVHDFASGKTEVFQPKQMPGGHGGGDDGLIRQFVGGVEAVLNGETDVETAQKRFVGCTLEDVLRSHALCFAAEEAREKGVVVDWKQWWAREVEGRLGPTETRSEMSRDDRDREWEVISPPA